MSSSNNSVIEKSNFIISGLLKHDEEDPCVHTLKQILDEIFGHENKVDLAQTGPTVRPDPSQSVQDQAKGDELI